MTWSISGDAMSAASGRLERCGFRAGEPFANRAGQRGLFEVAM